MRDGRRSGVRDNDDARGRRTSEERFRGRRRPGRGQGRGRGRAQSGRGSGRARAPAARGRHRARLRAWPICRARRPSHGRWSRDGRLRWRRGGRLGGRQLVETTSARLEKGGRTGLGLAVWRRRVTMSFLTKTPCFSVQLKYRFPPTPPSFFPFGSSSSIPIHSPAAKSVSPVNRTVPKPVMAPRGQLEGARWNTTAWRRTHPR